MAAVHASEIGAAGIAVGVLGLYDVVDGGVAAAAASGWGGEGEDGSHDGR